MTRINLLPWRETHRIEKNNEFYVVLAICMAIAAAIGFGGYKFAEGKVTHQEARKAGRDQRQSSGSHGDHSTASGSATANRSYILRDCKTRSRRCLPDIHETGWRGSACYPGKSRIQRSSLCTDESLKNDRISTFKLSVVQVRPKSEEELDNGI